MSTEVIKAGVKALHADKGDQWGNWEFPWGLLQEIHEITEESAYPVSMEEVESVLIALTKLDT